jgi:diguanylate cyclase (GGDEF)-like protein
VNSRVLLIDDSPSQHRLIEVWLRPLNLELQGAFGVEEGIRLARTYRPGLILLDLNLKDGYGLDLCMRLKADPQTANTPIVIVSAESRVEEKVKALNLGATDYIVKPFEPPEFQARVRSALRTKHLIDLLADRARIDGLTGLHNRAYFDERLESKLAHCRRYKDPLSCIMIDIDHFKRINDSYGHSVGDEVLRHVASALSGRCRREDVVCRYGGEEFAILTPSVSLNGAMTLAEDIRVIVAGLEIRAGDETVKITCSFGVAEFEAQEFLPLPQRADEALYFAKNSGRNRVCPELRFRNRPRVAS